MNILLCSERIPFPLTRGDNLRLYKIYKNLSKKHDIYLFYTSSTHSSEDFRKLLSDDIFLGYYNTEIPSNLIKARVVLSSTLFLTSNIDFRLDYLGTKNKISNAVNSLVKDHKINVIHVYNGDNDLGVLLADVRSAPKVLDLADSLSLFYWREFVSSRNPIRRFLNFIYYLRKKKYERYILNLYDVATVVSPVDRRHLRKINPRSNIKVIRNGVDIRNQSNQKRNGYNPKEVKEDYPSIVFFGNMSYPPNVDAALYIQKGILPLVRLKVPNTKFYIVGIDPADEIRELSRFKSIIVTGYVEDIHEYILKSNVVLIPMRKGCGIKNKILEAAALAKPIVVTPMGAEAFCKEIKKYLLIGRNTQELATKTIELLENSTLRVELGSKLSEIVRRKYTWKKCSEEYERLFQEIAKEN